MQLFLTPASPAHPIPHHAFTPPLTDSALCNSRLQALVRHSDLPSRCACCLSVLRAARLQRAEELSLEEHQALTCICTQLLCPATSPQPPAVPSHAVSPRHTSMRPLLVFSFTKELTFDPSGGPAFRSGEFLLIVCYLSVPMTDKTA